MKRKRYSEAQIAFALRQAESGTRVTEILRKLGVSEQTFYRWKRKYAGMGVAEIRRSRQLEDENRRLKQLVADLTLESRCFRMCSQKSSDARCEEGSGQRDEDVLPGIRAASMSDNGICTFNEPL